MHGLASWVSPMGSGGAVSSAAYTRVDIPCHDLPPAYFLDNVLVRLQGSTNIVDLINFRLTDDVGGLYPVTANVATAAVAYGQGSTSVGTVLYTSPLVLSARMLFAWIQCDPAGTTASSVQVGLNWRPLPGLQQ